MHVAWPPLYPWRIANVVRVLDVVHGPDRSPARFEFAARLVSVTAGALLLVPLFLVARRFLGVRAAAWAVVLAAVHPRLLQYSAAALSEMPFALAVAIGVAAWLARPEARRAAVAHALDALAGAALGAAYLARPEGAPLALALWLVNLWRARAARLRPAFLVAFALVALPYVLATHERLGRWSLGEKAGYNAWRTYAAAYDAAFGAPRDLARIVNDAPELTRDARPEAVNGLGLLARAPGLVLGTTAANLGRLAVATLPVVAYAPVFALALWGAIAARRRVPRELWVVLAAGVLLYAPISPDRRFLVPLVPWLVALAAAGIEAGGERWPRVFGHALVALLAVGSIVYAFAKGVRFDDAPEQRAAGEWLAKAWPGLAAASPDGAAHAPHARPVVMARKPWVAFYGDGLDVELPDAPLEAILARAAERGADVLVVDERSVETSRAALAPLLADSSAAPGLRRLWSRATAPRITLWDVRGLGTR